MVHLIRPLLWFVSIGVSVIRTPEHRLIAAVCLFSGLALFVHHLICNLCTMRGGGWFCHLSVKPICGRNCCCCCAEGPWPNCHHFNRQSPNLVTLIDAKLLAVVGDGVLLTQSWSIDWLIDWLTAIAAGQSEIDFVLLVAIGNALIDWIMVATGTNNNAFNTVRASVN